MSASNRFIIVSNVCFIFFLFLLAASVIILILIFRNKKLKEDIKNYHTENEKILTQIKTFKELEYLLDRIYHIIYPESKATIDYKTNADELLKTAVMLTERAELVEKSYSHLSAIPYMAEIMAEYSTHELDLIAQKLQWGHSAERAKKVESLHDLKRKTKEILQESNTAKYQLAYLLTLFPVLEEYLDAEFSDVPVLQSDDLKTDAYDRARDYLTAEEYRALSTTDKNQLALDRYVASHQKTKWQIGRDYELYIGYLYRKKGFTVDTCGSYLGVNDLGRDLICTKGPSVLIVQCKYWSEIKTIHENHIAQLYGTVVAYCIETNRMTDEVKGVMITNIKLSDTAKRFSQYLGIKYLEEVQIGDFPRIKCNIGRSDRHEKIYHLPFDQQYDTTKITGPDEFFAYTVREAEDQGFRRAHKWHGE